MNTFDYLVELPEEQLINLLCDFYLESIENPVYFKRSNVSIRNFHEIKESRYITLQKEKHVSSIILEVIDTSDYSTSLFYRYMEMIGNLPEQRLSLPKVGDFSTLQSYIRKRKLANI